MREKYDQAGVLYREAYEREQALDGVDSPQSVAILTSLGDVAYALAKYAEAEPLYRKALSVATAKFGARSLENADVLERLANLLRQTNQEKEAKKLEADAKAIRAEATPANPPR